MHSHRIIIYCIWNALDRPGNSGCHGSRSNAEEQKNENDGKDNARRGEPKREEVKEIANRKMFVQKTS